MPTEGPKSVENWLDCELSGVEPTLDGGLENARDNRVRDAALQDLGRGGTRTMRLLEGPKDDGFHFYSTPANGRESTLIRQTGIPQRPGDRSRLEEQPIFEIGQRPRRPFDRNLPQLIVKKVALAENKQGYPGGWRLASIGGRTIDGAYTTTTEPIAFEHGNGQHLDWYPPSDPAPGIHEWVLFLSEEAASEGALRASTMREQDSTNARRGGSGVATATGPYDRRGKKRPNSNETFIGREGAPKWGDEETGDLRVGPAPGNMEGTDNVGVSFVFTTRRGDTLASTRSATRNFPPLSITVKLTESAKKDDTTLHIRPLDGRLEKGHILTFTGNVRVRLRESSPRGARHLTIEPLREALGGAADANTQIPRPDEALWVKPKSPPKDATGFKVFVHIGGVSYRVAKAGAVYKFNAWGLDEWIPIYFNIAADTIKRFEDGRRTVLVPGDVPEEDASGVEGPTGQADSPVGKGSTRPPAGKYRKTYSISRGGVEGRAAVPVEETITASEMLSLRVPSATNRLPNAAGTRRGADGLPYAWDDGNLTNGVISDALGKLGVATSGLVNDTGSATPYRQSDPIPVNAEVAETVRGILEVSGYAGTGGAGRHQLIQIRPGQSATATVLANRTSNGFTPYAKTIGQTGSGADIILDEGTAEIAVRIGTDASAGRNMTVRGFDLAIHPFKGSPRKFVLPPPGSANIADPDAPFEAPYEPGPVVVITRPQSTIDPPGFTPLEVLPAEEGSPETAVNPTTRGWSATRSPATGLTGLAASTTNAIEPAYSFRAFSEAATVRASAYWSKIYGPAQVNGSSLAARGPFAFPLFPTRSGNKVMFAAILDAVNNYMGFLRVSNAREIELWGRTAQNRDRMRVALSGLSPSEVSDVELIVGGGNTTRGRVSLVGSVGGESRDVLATIEDLDFTGRVPRQVRFMGIQEMDTAGRWEMICDWLRITHSGDVVESFGEGLVIPADRPTGADGVLRELDEDDQPINQLYIHVPPSFSGAGEEYGAVFDDFFVPPGVAQTLAVYARWEDLAPQATDTVRLTLFDSLGNVWRAPSPIPAGVSGSAGWADLLAHLTPPLGFYRGRLEVKRTESGMLILQELVETDGTL